MLPSRKRRRNSSEITDVFISALSNRLPRITLKPAASFSGADGARITPVSAERVAPTLAATSAPVTVSGVPSRRPAARSSPITAGTPPARWKASHRCFPDGAQSTRSGRLRPCSSQSAISSSTPAWRATACRCGGAFVEPPIAVFTRMALRNAARVSTSEGLTSSCTSETARRPVRYAIWPRSRYGAGIAEQPGSDIPSASASAFIVDAVPIVLQWPALGALAHTRSMNSSYSMSPAASCRRPSQITAPDPASSPAHQPSSIGPPDSTIAGRSTVAAAISSAGVVLSQPVVRTTPSSG